MDHGTARDRAAEEMGRIKSPRLPPTPNLSSRKTQNSLTPYKVWGIFRRERGRSVHTVRSRCPFTLSVHTAGQFVCDAGLGVPSGPFVLGVSED
jgi:hypothetical protein